MINKNI